MGLALFGFVLVKLASEALKELGYTRRVIDCTQGCLSRSCCRKPGVRCRKALLQSLHSGITWESFDRVM